MTLFIIILILYLSFLIYNRFYPKPINKLPVSYLKKPLLTNYEKSFYDKLQDLTRDYIVLPQVNLASIIEKKSHYKYKTELFRNIDFGIFDKNTFDVLLLIELNDKTHKTASRRKRDLTVKSICDKANIKLITFYTTYPNEKSYVLNRIQKELQTTNKIIE